MAEEVGSVLYGIWTYPAQTVRGASYPAGTVVLTTDYRTMTPVDDTMKSVDKSAGNDTEVTYIKTLKDGKIAATFLHDGGTVLFGALATGTEGTLIYGPSGTADGKMKITRPAFIDSSKLQEGYDTLSIWDVSWKPSATGTYSTWSSGA